ncbi:MAG: hypothetical protein ACREJK_02165 [Candidatus Methylomirabilales bacterium]
MKKKRIAAILIGLALVALVVPVWADTSPDESTLEQIGIGTGSVVGSVVYFPVKASFCVLGGLSSIYTSLFVGPKTTHEVLSLTCRGNWAVSPHHLKGEESLTFIGDVPGDIPPSTPNVEPEVSQ